MEVNPSPQIEPPAHSRIALDWPGKNGVAIPTPDGWSVDNTPRSVDLRPLIPAIRSDAERPSFAVLGDRIPALVSAERMFGRCAALVYVDLPRVEGYDETRAFQVVSDFTWSTWLTVIKQHLSGVRKLMRHDGAIVIQCGDAELPFVRLIADEIFGRANYLGPIVWQSHYSPKGGKPTSDIAAIHDVLLVYAYEREMLGPISTIVAPDDYANSDNDPRGPWQAKQKDAGRDTVKMTYVVPPYRWRLVDGELPPGLWRISPFSGAIFGTPTCIGKFEFDVEVSDSTGKTSIARCVIDVGDSSVAHESDSAVWWLDSPAADLPDVPLKTKNVSKSAQIGKPFSMILHAAGGTPNVGEKRPSRGWAFGRQTLVNAILEDRCYFGVQGTAIPETKKYLRDLEGGYKRVNFSSWWSGKDVGFSQDATKFLNELKSAGLIEDVVPAPKPETLLGPIMEAMSKIGDTVVELFCKAGDLSSVALKSGRRFLAFPGGGYQERTDFKRCALPRLNAVLSGDTLAAVDDYIVAKPSAEQRSDGVWTVELGDPVAERASPLDTAELVDNGRDPLLILRDVVAASGFVVEPEIRLIDDLSRVLLVGRSVEGDRWAYGVAAADYLQASHVALVASTLPESCVEATIFYFRSIDLDRVPNVDARVRLCRIPVEMRF